MLTQLMNDPLATIVSFLYSAPAILIALTLHEVAHGYVALKCGDPTAQMLGRLSLNPLKHLDPIGTAFMFLFGFGWARPVPVNPRNYKHFKRDEVLVAVAGVTTNLILFACGTLVMIGINQLLWKPELFQVSALTTRENMLRFDGVNFYAVLDPRGAYLYTMSVGDGRYFVADMAQYLRTPWLIHVQRFVMRFCSVNLGLALFNLLPVPPLDGYHVFNNILLRGRLRIPPRVMQGVMIALMVVMLSTDWVGRYLSAGISAVQGVALRGLLAVFGLL